MSRFRFDDVAYEGFAGDTLASALLANGVLVVGHGIYSGRPRGVFSAGEEEPNALVQVRWPNGVSEPIAARDASSSSRTGSTRGRSPGKGRLDGEDRGAVRQEVRPLRALVVGGGAAGRRGGRGEAGRPGAPRRRRAASSSRSTASQVLGARRRPSGSTTTATCSSPSDGRAPDRRPALAHPGGADRARHRGPRTTDRLPRQRSAGDDAGGRGRCLRRALRRVAGSRGSPLATTNDSANRASADACSRHARRGARRGSFDLRRGERRRRHGRADCSWCRAAGTRPRSLVTGRRQLRFDDRIGASVPDGELRNVEVVGPATGEGCPDSAAPPSATAPATRTRTFVDLERDATVADIRRALGAGLTSIEHVKRYTTIGTGSDQGKTGGVLASRASPPRSSARSPARSASPTFRPPYVPVSFAQLAGRDRGELHDPVRTTLDPPVARRPRRGVRGRRPVEATALLPARRRVDGRRRPARVARRPASAVGDDGRLDPRQDRRPGPGRGRASSTASTRTLLERSRSARAATALMCRADGMVLDDGVTSRLGDDRFLMTTTTGNAAPVLDWLEEWLQTEWPELRVRAHVGHRAVGHGRRRRARRRATSCGRWRRTCASKPRSFPFMAVREARGRGHRRLACSASRFSGELAYEVNVPTWHGLALWEAVMAAGEPFGITPYGTEAMHVLRAEKGYPIVGQETDGTVTPHDLGMDWIVSKQKSFIGKRSLREPTRSRTDRKQLVGAAAGRPVRAPAGRARSSSSIPPHRSRCRWSAT